MARVLVLEMNELTPQLVTSFMADGHLPNFHRLYDESYIYTTDAGESGLNLNPWIQWFTVHSGVPFSEHQVYLLGEGHTKEIPTLGSVISDSGRGVELFGSMNVGFNRPLNGHAMPDAWADGIVSYPEELEPFRKFVQFQVQEHTNPEFRLTTGDYLEFLRFMMSHGLSFGTVREIVWQLASEKFSDRRWMRPFILDSLQWDAFAYIYRKHKPAFATYFTNSVAHTQHTHWREFEPEKFDLKPSDSDVHRFGNAIRQAYVRNDRLIEKAMSLADDETTLIFCTALSQRPAADWDTAGGKTFYRPYDLDLFTHFLGVDFATACRPVMAEEYWIEFGSNEDLHRGLQILEGATAGDERLMKTYVRDRGIYTGCRLHSSASENADIVTHDGRRAPLKSHLYKSRDVKSGMHDRHGLLWISLPSRRHEKFDKSTVRLEAIAPSILRLLGIPPASQMKEPVLPELFDR